jgi:hypothetical protein
MTPFAESPVGITIRGLVRRPVIHFWSTGLRPNDVLLASYPSSGSTWLRFMLYEALTGEPTAFEIVYRAIPYISRHRSARVLLPNSGRLIKTHEVHHRGGIKAIYLVRDVRDVAVSEYRAAARAGRRDVSFDRFLSGFLTGHTSVFGAWQDHVNHWLADRNDEEGTFLLVRYEDLRADTELWMKRLLRFLGVVDHGFVSAAIRNNSIEHMRTKETAALQARCQSVDPRLRFVGEGPVAGWAGRLSTAQVERVRTRAGSALARLGYLDET